MTEKLLQSQIKQSLLKVQTYFLNKKSMNHSNQDKDVRGVV